MVSCLKDIDTNRSANKISACASHRHVLTLCPFPMYPSLFSHFLLLHSHSSPHNLFKYFDSSCYFLFLPPPLICLSFLRRNPLLFYASVFIYVVYHLLAFTSFPPLRPLVASLSIFHPWVPLKLKKKKKANCNRRQ